MAYIPFTYAPMEKSAEKRYNYNLFHGGVSLVKTEVITEKGKAERLCNFDLKDNAVQTRAAAVTLSQGTNIQGELHCAASKPFGGKIIMHIGASLYALDDASQGFCEICSSLPDEQSVMCEFLSELYIYCGGRIFSLDIEFTLTEHMPYAPLIYENVIPLTGSAIRTDEGYNMCAPVVRARYNADYYQPENVYTYFKFPVSADTTRPVLVYVNDELLSEEDYTVGTGGVSVKTDLSANTDVVEVAFFLNGMPEETDDGFRLCGIAEAFGGNINGGTRLFMTGNPDRKGVYYRSALQDPLHFPEQDTEIIGNGSEEITAMKRMYGDLIIFTKDSVYRMSYNPSYEISPFAVKEIGNGVGCDCPGSICLIDNRIVFLNSKKGVFIVDSTESTGEQNLKPISGNVLSGHTDGLLDTAENARKGCCSIDYDRKYILCVGDRMYIWDYDKSPYKDSGSYALSQQRLIWYIYSFDRDFGFLYEKDKTLLCVEKESYAVSCFDEDVRCGTEARFSSGRLGVGGEYEKKQIRGMELVSEAFENGNVTFNFYADGVLYCTKSIDVRAGKRSHIKMRLPSKTLMSFSFDMTACAGIRLEGISFIYRSV